MNLNDELPPIAQQTHFDWLDTENDDFNIELHMFVKYSVLLDDSDTSRISEQQETKLNFARHLLQSIILKQTMKKTMQSNNVHRL